MSSLWNLFSLFSSLFGGYESEGNGHLFPIGECKTSYKKKSRHSPIHTTPPTTLSSSATHRVVLNSSLIREFSITSIVIGKVIFALTYTGQGLLLLTQSENALASYQFLGPMCLCVGLNEPVLHFFLSEAFFVLLFVYLLK